MLIKPFEHVRDGKGFAVEHLQHACKVREGCVVTQFQDIAAAIEQRAEVAVSESEFLLRGSAPATQSIDWEAEQNWDQGSLSDLEEASDVWRGDQTAPDHQRENFFYCVGRLRNTPAFKPCPDHHVASGHAPLSQSGHVFFQVLYLLLQVRTRAIGNHRQLFMEIKKALADSGKINATSQNRF